MRKNKKEENYLERVPVYPTRFTWSQDGEGIVTLHIENKGIFKRITQILIKKPKVSHIHLDEMGSFIWLEINGERSLAEIGEAVEGHFGEAARPTYERLSQFFRMLDSYKFIDWRSQSSNQ